MSSLTLTELLQLRDPKFGEVGFTGSRGFVGSSGFTGSQGPSNNATTYGREVYFATAAQTTFATTYDVGFVDVWLNGVKLLGGTDFTATNGTSIVLATGAAENDIVEIISFEAFDIANALVASNNLSDVPNPATAITNLGLTATAAELNILDGVTATTAELNILDGVTATTAELNILDGVTATAAELNFNDITTLGTSQASKVVTADANGDVNLSEELKAKSYNETVVALTGTTPAVNCETGNVFTLTTSGNTTFTFTNPPASGTAYAFTLRVTAGGTHTLTYPASVDFAGGTAPDAPANGETDVLVFFTTDGGTTFFGFQAGDALA